MAAVGMAPDTTAALADDDSGSPESSEILPPFLALWLIRLLRAQPETLHSLLGPRRQEFVSFAAGLGLNWVEASPEQVWAELRARQQYLEGLRPRPAGP